MELKEAKNITKSYKQNGTEITPTLSDDWTYSFDSYYNSDDKVIIKSINLGITVSIAMNIQSFFVNYIYNKKLLIDGDKLIGEFAFNKYSIVMKDKFNEATEVVSLSESNGVIPNSELIDFGLYLDDKGDSFVYLGNMSYNMFYISNNDNNMQTNKNLKKRYIVKYNKSSIDYDTKIIQKNGKRKFIELDRVLSLSEKETFLSELFSRGQEMSNIFCIQREAGNEITTILSDKDSYRSSIIKYGDKYGVYIPKPYWNTNESESFIEIDMDKMKKDILSNDFKEMNKYKISEDKNFIFDEKIEIYTVRLYIDYI